MKDKKANGGKERIGLYLTKENLLWMQDNREAGDIKSRSEFVNQGDRFLCGVFENGKSGNLCHAVDGIRASFVDQFKRDEDQGDALQTGSRTRDAEQDSCEDGKGDGKGNRGNKNQV